MYSMLDFEMYLDKSVHGVCVGCVWTGGECHCACGTEHHTLL